MYYVRMPPFMISPVCILVAQSSSLSEAESKQNIEQQRNSGGKTVVHILLRYGTTFPAAGVKIGIT